MQHGVRQTPLSQAMQRFFTFFFLLNRAPSTIRVGRPCRTISYSQLHSAGHNRKARFCSSQTQGDSATKPSQHPTKGRHVQTEDSGESHESLRQEMATAVKHARQAEAAANEVKARYRRFIKSGGKNTATQARRKGQILQESGKTASTNKATQASLSQVKNADTGLDRVVRNSSVDALQDKLNNLFRENIRPQAKTTETEDPTVAGVPPDVAASPSPVTSLAARATDSEAELHKPEDDTAPSNSLSDIHYVNIPTKSKLVGLLRHMPNSVVVVTALAPSSDGDSQDQNGRAIRAMTASSFTCVSMERDPVISFNVKQPSRTLQAIQGGREFVVHILDGGPHGALIADAFTAGDAEAGFHRIAADPINATVHAPSRPEIKHKSVVATLHCELREPEVAIQDHTVVFGTVKQINVGRSRRGATEEEPYLPFRGLLYQNKGYRAIGKLIIDPRRSDLERS